MQLQSYLLDFRGDGGPADWHPPVTLLQFGAVHLKKISVSTTFFTAQCILQPIQMQESHGDGVNRP